MSKPRIYPLCPRCQRRHRAKLACGKACSYCGNKEHNFKLDVLGKPLDRCAQAYLKELREEREADHRARVEQIKRWLNSPMPEPACNSKIAKVQALAERGATEHERAAARAALARLRQ